MASTVGSDTCRWRGSLVKTRQRIRRVPFLAPTPFGVEVMTIASLWGMAPPGYLRSPQRPAFHLLIFCSAGTMTHTFEPDFLLPNTQAAEIANDPFGPVAIEHPAPARPARGCSARRGI